MAKQKTSRLRTVLSNVSVRFFDKWRAKSVLFGLLFVVGLLSYTTFLPREGFPPIQFPLTLVNGAYFVDDAEAVDRDVVVPALEAIKEVEGISETSTSSSANNFNLVIFFEESVDSEAANDRLRTALEDAQVPTGVEFNLVAIDPAAYLNEYDLLLAVGVSNPEANQIGVEQLQQKAETVAEQFAADSRIESAEVVELIRQAPDPLTGQLETRQTNFNFFAQAQEGQSRVNFYDAITVGVNKTDELDIIELSTVSRELAAEIENDEQLKEDDVDIAIGADFASAIDTQINSLQSNLITGILAVSLVSWALITWRASLVTAVFMIGVMLVTMIILWVVGYTLNTITLFALVLSLGLFVDDSTIITEAIVAARTKGKSAREAVKEAAKKVAPASIAGTLTTVFVFLPLAFITGILGEFIRLLPITVIVSLLASLVLSLTLIPLLTRFGFKGMNTASTAKSRALDSIADFFAAMPMLLKTRPQLGRFLGLAMVGLSVAFLMGTGFFAQKVEFNIFPSSDDADQLSITYEFASGTTLEEAEAAARRANTVIAEELGDNVVRALYGGFGPSNERSADVVVELMPFTERELTSKDFISRLEQPLAEAVGSTGEVQINQIDSSPPVEDLPFKVQIFGENSTQTIALAQDIERFLAGRTIERMNGTTTKITETDIQNTAGVSRQNGDSFVQVAANFEDSDISALVNATQEAVEEEFSQERLKSYGSTIELGFDFGQESDSAESFEALGIVFPVAIGAILLLLAIQFRSIVQPLLIILAVPFSLLGVFFGLYITDNSLSFFSAVGLIGLIGIAVNNTILLTDYANQEKQAGKDRIAAISVAVKQRFRPLVTTTLTTIVALLPLALNDPFWEPLAYTIIFGLASSTILVILSFPYYYIMAEAGVGIIKTLWRRIRSR